MMIKYKALTIDGRYWICGNLVIINDNYYILPECGNVLGLTDVSDDSRRHASEYVSAYIRLVDKNTVCRRQAVIDNYSRIVAIYDNDIVKTVYGEYDKETGRYTHEDISVVPENRKLTQTELNILSSCKVLDIIGNIKEDWRGDYECPEMNLI